MVDNKINKIDRDRSNWNIPIFNVFKMIFGTKVQKQSNFIKAIHNCHSHYIIYTLNIIKQWNCKKNLVVTSLSGFELFWNRPFRRVAFYFTTSLYTQFSKDNFGQGYFEDTRPLSKRFQTARLTNFGNWFRKCQFAVWSFFFRAMSYFRFLNLTCTHCSPL